MTKILHISDWHGRFREIPEDLKYDLVVCSGDMLPNCSRGDVEKEVIFQERWSLSNLNSFRKLLKGKQFLFCGGNHDYFDLCKLLRDYGIDAVDITENKVIIDGISFYGFPYIPYIAGEWNWETMPSDLSGKCYELAEVFPIDVFVPHCPLGGYLDVVSDGRTGNNMLTNSFLYGELTWPKLILCGHLHEAYGAIDLGDCIISNASCGWRVLEV